ncbi:MAG: ATP-grasp domain-containing protein [Campylobacteraceae bacterium]|jgi:ribosomal protein S6--L-glutamate ligase|nr:ATP-grasp domain-containing protein [Campylobacteraceae bacterium]MBT3882113.1 ATP-grasp domain-containing protein [Campylobacteraceae bacterium]MBT4030106.1 ATP-grasp domain-containing protein [Campylobacteraceae bacterium]MBT4178820.1 ATP-grasp domain-containing protein [Campylobacteraceae bacterium]MBT4572049.1 ATP-grasp domain-containing protein [Campylobacteraceae bacterium]
MAKNRTIGIWMYQNGGGDIIEQKMVQKLKERGIDCITGLNLRNAISKNGSIICQDVNGKDIKMETLDLMFSYNAGEQTQYQTYLYQALNRIVPMINSYESFALTEDKFHTSFVLRNAGIATADYKLCHRDDAHQLKKIITKWDKMVYKPTDGWGGMGLTKIENEDTLDMLMPFLNQMDLRYFYVEKFITYDNSDFRVDIVDGEFVSCYGRKASGNDWRTNITAGGSVFMRDASEEIIDVAKRACEACGVDIGGVDIIYDEEKEEYVVLEVNGIPAFATPEQEGMGLKFNDRKIDLIVDLIDRKTK